MIARRMLLTVLCSACLLFVALSLSGSAAAKPGDPTAQGEAAQTVPAACLPIWTNGVSPTSTIRSLVVLTPNDLWAVSGSELILHGDTNAMLSVPHPTPTPLAGFPVHNVFEAIAARSDDDVWVAGYRDDSTDLKPPVIMHLTDSGVTSMVADAVKPEHPQGGDIFISTFRSIVPVGPTEMWAVGSSGPTISSQRITQATHCDSGGCVAHNPVNPGVDNALYGVDALSRDDVWAVGSYRPAMTITQFSLVQHWNGTAWNNISVPNAGVLNSVSIAAADDIWAVGETGSLHYDGNAWQVVDAPAGLTAVIAFAPDDAWAVGNTYSHWDGSAWTERGTPPGRLYALTALNRWELWAGGQMARPATAGLLMRAQLEPIFGDVSSLAPPNPFFPYITGLACHGFVSGYGGLFNTGSDVTRGQLAKIIAQTAGLNQQIPADRQTFSDVPHSDTFWLYVERLHEAGIISGYECGAGCLEYRPYSSATRGQIAKIVALAAHIEDEIPADRQTFSDVSQSNTFWLPIEQLAARGIISGYDLPGGGREFRVGANTTRGQMAKIAANALILTAASEIHN